MHQARLSRRVFGKRAGEITDKATWEYISHALAIGFNHLIAIVQPDVIVLGGGVSAHFSRFGAHLSKELKRFETPMTPVPPIISAQRPEEAVLFGCYDLARSTYGPVARPA